MMKWLITFLFVVSCGTPPVRPPSLWKEPPPVNSGSNGEISAGTSPTTPEEEDEANQETGDGEGIQSEESPVGEPPVPGTVVVNEIFYDAAGSDTDGVLFVELYGTSGMDLSGVQILFVNGADGATTDSITLPDGAEVQGDGFYLIADSRTGDAAATQVPGGDLIDNFDPQNGPESVLLLDPEGNLLDVVGYGEGMVETTGAGYPAWEGRPAVDVVGGHSLERGAAGLDTNDNSADFVEREEPTPGY